MINGYNKQEPFRFWCQKVLPTEYDDSLSYYELLNKVVNYLNITSTNVDTLHTATEEYIEAFNTLKNFVDNYFDTLDVQAEINAKLDDMAQSGELSTLVSPFIPDIVSEWLDENITPTTPPIDASLTISNAAADAGVVGNILFGGSEHTNKTPIVKSFFRTPATESEPFDPALMPRNSVIFISKQNLTGFDEGGVFEGCPVEFSENDVLRIEKTLLRPDLQNVSASIYFITTPKNQLVCWRSSAGVNTWTQLASKADTASILNKLNNSLNVIEEHTENLLILENIEPISNVTVDINNTVFHIKSTAAQAFRYAYFDLHATPGTYFISGIKNAISGQAGVFYSESSDGTSYPLPWQTLIPYSATNGIRNTASFTTNTGFVRIVFFCTGQTAEIGEALYTDFMLSANEALLYVPATTAIDYIARKSLNAIEEHSENLLNLGNIKPISNVSVEIDGTKFHVKSTSAQTYRYAYFDLHTDPGTYFISGIKNVVSGTAGVFYSESSDGTTYPLPWQTLIGYTAANRIRNTASFTTTTGFVRIAFFCTASTAEIGEALYTDFMLSANEALPYVPPITAMDYIAREMATPKYNLTTTNIFKKVVCVGDSYTEGWINTGTGGAAYKDYSWVAFMSKHTGNNWVNCGVSGATTLSWLSGRGLSEAQAAGRAQAYVIGLMINDASTGLEVGTISDIENESPTTYYGCLAKIIRELNAISPAAKIFVNTCPKSWESMPPYQQAVRDVVSAYSNTYPVHLIDLKEKQYMYEADSFTSDYIQLHYTAIGYEQMAEIYNAILSEYINANVSEFQDVHSIPYD